MELLMEMRKEVQELEDEIIQMVWYMKGTLSWDQAWNLTYKERARIFNFLKDAAERAKKAGVPFI